MASKPNERGRNTVGTAWVRRLVSLRTVVMVLIGVTAGYSTGMVGADVVAVPLVGAVPGPVVGLVGLTGAAVAYWQLGCCGDCGRRKVGPNSGCRCGGDCGDSCTVDP